MTTLAEIRAQYPQYSDMSDAALADGLHKKFYADMPRSEFDAKIGFTTKPGEVPSGRTSKPTREELIAAIPGTPAAAPTAASAPGLKDRIIGTAEVPLAVAQGLVTMPIAAGAALYKKATGQPSDIDAEMARFAYQPTTQTGRENLQALGQMFEASKLPPMPGVTGGLATAGLNRLAGPALRQAAATPVAQAIQQKAGSLSEAVTQPLTKIAEERQANRVAQSYERAPQIEAAQEAQKYGVNLNPEISNPSVKSKLMGAMVGEDANQVLSKSNKTQWNKIALDDMGLPKTTKLDAKAFEEAHALPELTKPYEAVKGITKLNPNEEVLASLENLRQESLIGGEASAGAIDRLVDSAIKTISGDLTGEKAITNIKNLRRNANATYQAQSKGIVPPSAEALSIADTQMGIANALEGLIESNISDPKLLSEFRAARTKHAQIYDWERATDIATGQVDPKVLADMVRKNQPLSEAQGAIGRIAANYPEIAKVENVHSIRPRLTRAGAAGSAGASLGWLAGGYPGAVIGGVLGGALSQGVRYNTLNRMRNPAFQAANAIPIDYRLPVVNQMAQRPPVSNLPVPFDYGQAVNQGEPSYQPNWTYGRQGVNPDIRPEMPGAQNLLSAPTGTEAMDLVQRQRQWQYQQERAAANAAAAREEAVAASTRKPASGEQLFDFDPITGRLRSSSRGLPGATLDVIESTGKSLESASQKIASGRNFDMTAAEKVAWDKTRTSLSEVSPEFRTLTDKQILERMRDRQWIAETVKKSREKAEAFNKIAGRSEQAQQIREAIKRRDELMDLAESLDEMMQQGRPVRKTGQGPKTREAIRNMLLGQ